MNKNSLVIKGNKYGIALVMDEAAEFEELKQQLRDKLKESAKFFGKGTMAISFEGKQLTDGEKKEMLDVISEISELNIVCIIDENEELMQVFKNSVEKIEEMVDNETEAYEQMRIEPQEELGNTGKFFRGTLRSGQVLESDTSIVIIGDVNPGASVSAGGNVIILGSLKGTVSAGLGGDKSAFIVALDMAPVQVRIGDIIARCSEKPKRGKTQTKIAYLDGDAIYIDPLSKDLLNVLKF